MPFVPPPPPIPMAGATDAFGKWWMREGMFHTAESGAASITMSEWDAAKQDKAL